MNDWRSTGGYLQFPPLTRVPSVTFWQSFSGLGPLVSAGLPDRAEAAKRPFSDSRGSWASTILSFALNSSSFVMLQRNSKVP